jgi:hypothetical protein
MRASGLAIRQTRAKPLAGEHCMALMSASAAMQSTGVDRGFVALRRVWAIKGTGSFGAGLATFLLERGEPPGPHRANGRRPAQGRQGVGREGVSVTTGPASTPYGGVHFLRGRGGRSAGVERTEVWQERAWNSGMAR